MIIKTACALFTFVLCLNWKLYVERDVNEYFPDDIIQRRNVMVPSGSCHVSMDQLSALSTRSLGSTVAVGVYDPQTGAVGLAHICYPDSTKHPRFAQQSPGKFADKGVSQLVAALEEAGSDLENHSCIVTIIGGGKQLGTIQAFNHGEETIDAVREQLKHYGFSTTAEDLVGHRDRRVAVYGDTGDMCVVVNGKQYKLV